MVILLSRPPRYRSRRPVGPSKTTLESRKRAMASTTAYSAEPEKYYHVITAYPGLKQRHLIPKTPKLDERGKPLASKYNTKGFWEEDCPKSEIYRRRITRWGTSADELGKLDRKDKTAINSIKNFLADRPVLWWFHNAQCELDAEFGGPHLHVVTRTGPSMDGTVGVLSNQNKYRTIRKSVDDAGGHTKAERINNVENVILHCDQPPRVYMGTNCPAFGRIFAIARANRPTKLADLRDCLIKRVDVNIALGIEDGPDTTGDWGECDASDQERADEDDEWSFEPKSMAKRARAETDDFDLPQQGEGFLAGRPFPERPLLEGGKQPERSALDALGHAPKLTIYDRSVMVIRTICEFMRVYTFEQLNVEILKLPPEHLIAIRWEQIKYRTNIERQVAAVCTQESARYTLLTVQDLAREFMKHGGHRNLKYAGILDSMYMIECWCKTNNIPFVDYIGQTISVLNKTSGKKNAIMAHGPSNGGKSIFLHNPIADLCVFVGEVTNIGSSSQFAYQSLVNKRVAAIDEAVFAPEQLEMLKKITGGERTQVEVKFQRPQWLERIPVILTCNNYPWRANAQEAVAFKNRMHIWEIVSDDSLKDLLLQINPAVFDTFSKVYQEHNLEAWYGRCEVDCVAAPPKITFAMCEDIFNNTPEVVEDRLNLDDE